MKGKYEGTVLIMDLDGTLLNSEKAITEENLGAIRKFVQNGGRFGVATGRSPKSAVGWLAQLPVNAPSVFYNGSMVKDTVADRVLCCHWLDREYFIPQIEWILDHSRETVVEIFTPEGLYLVSDPQYCDPYLEQEHDPYLRDSLDRVKELPWMKILLYDTHEALEVIEKKMFSQPKSAGCNHFFSLDFFFEITPSKATKGNGLAAVREALKEACGESAVRIIAAGDYENDIGMLREADCGVAVGNALEEVKRAADYVAADHDRHPAAEIIRLLEEGRLPFSDAAPSQ